MPLEQGEITARLRATLDGYAPLGQSAQYAIRMWRFALSAAAKGVDPEVNGQCDAVPYVPVVPEDLGLVLTRKSQMLDLGCLGGYGLYDFARRRRADGKAVPRMVGADLDPDSVRLGREIAEVWAGDDDVTFHEVNAESLPFEDSSFDLVVARLLLPYVRMRPAMGEIMRVLKPGGVVLLQLHSFSYYWRGLLLHRSRASQAWYYLRPLLSGLWFGITRRQPCHRWFSETALTPWCMAVWGRKLGLRDVWRGGFSQKPLVALRKGE